MVVCPSLSPFTMMKVTTYGGRHLSHIQPFLSLSRVLFRARTFLLFNSLSLSNGKASCRTVSNMPGGKAFPFGESGAQAPREVTKLHDRKFLLNNFQTQKKIADIFIPPT